MLGPFESNAKPSRMRATLLGFGFIVFCSTTWLLSTPCHAQGDSAKDIGYQHDSIYFRVALGAGWTQAHFDGSVEAQGSGVAALMAVGYTPEVMPHAAIGLGLVGIAAKSEATAERIPYAPSTGRSPRAPDDVALGVVGLAVDVFPNPSDGLHLGLIAGRGSVVITPADAQDGAAMVHTKAPGASLFFGYDVWVGPELSLGATMVAMHIVDASPADGFSHEFDRSMTGSAFAFMGAILWH